MIIKIKFEFIGALKNDCLTFSSSSFAEDGERYVNEVVCLETEEKMRVPPYCPEKSLAGLFQSHYPQGRVTVVEEKGVS